MTVSTLDLSAGSTFIEEIAGTTACTSYDRTNVTGTAALNDATLNIALTTTPADGTVFTIVSAASITGTFAGLANGASITANGVTFRINYSTTTVTLTKLTGTATVTPNTGMQKQNVALVAASLVASLGLLFVVRRYGKKTTR
jgi:LPXTG-motif cell wall-anchored protein